MSPPRRGAGLALLALLLVVLPGAAGAQSVSLRVEPSYTYSDQRSTDSTGRATQQYLTDWDTKLSGSLRQELFPLLRFYASGNYERDLASSSTEGVAAESQRDLWRLYGRLSAGDAILNGILDYDRSRDGIDTRSAGLTTPGLVLETQRFGASAGWRPEGLPRLDLRLSRSEQHDPQRALVDQTADLAQLSLSQELRRAQATYNFSYSHPVDRLNGNEVHLYGNAVGFTWADTFLDGRVGAGADYQGSQTTRRLSVLRPGGTIESRVPPVQGLSGLESGGVLPTRITLSGNPGLIDGDAGPGAGNNIGYRPSRAGDTDPREIGARLADLTVPVSTLFVVVDRPLSAPVVAAFTAGGVWTAYQSGDNVDWTPVALAGPVTYDVVQNRFQIPLPSTAALYLKVVVRPLGAAVTSDTRFETIQVTEIQLANLVPAQSLAGRLDTIQGTANANLRVDILRSGPRLTYDFQSFLRHRNSGTRLTYSITNGLSLDQPLSRVLALAARVDRTDADLSQGHEAAHHYSARLTAQPIPAASATLSYVGQHQETRQGTSISNGLLLFARAEPYRGISTTANLTWATGRQATGEDTRTAGAQVATTLVPHPAVSLSGTYAYQENGTRSAAVDSVTVVQRVEGGVTAAPFQALYLSASVARAEAQGRWNTIANFTGTLSPFPGGELTLSFHYTETLDTTNDGRSRDLGPYLRWTFRSGAFVEGTYSFTESTSRTGDNRIRSASARLAVPL